MNCIEAKGTTTDLTTVDSDAIWIQTPSGRRFYLMACIDNSYPPLPRQVSGEFPAQKSYSVPPCFLRTSATLVFPSRTAQNNGVWPESSLELTSAPRAINTSAATGLSLLAA